jgi:hypothetical protein
MDFVCLAQPELASPKARLAFAKQRLATEGDWLLKIRCTLKNKDPLVADEDNLVRQRSAVLRP